MSSYIHNPINNPYINRMFLPSFQPQPLNINHDALSSPLSQLSELGTTPSKPPPSTLPVSSTSTPSFQHHKHHSSLVDITTIPPVSFYIISSPSYFNLHPFANVARSAAHGNS
ncbi:Protein of unknown function [Pyronema omphalodes CBS 100304]|uniref:Uncharacterized protein n=1 Tax=Pyronema omphalodes (strain CBS 100304) TaxID=1076935 RepID=U4LV26_PYROM|nr:Protein of unknown function [Pyronema omphalodes CBS 100304]